MRTVRFIVHGRPQPRGSKRTFMPNGARFPVVTDDNPKSRPWMNAVAAEAQAAMAQAGLQLFDGPVYLRVVFWFVRPKGHFGKRGLRASAPEHHTVKPDATKLMRGLEDALKGIAWRDDSQVVEQSAMKRYGLFDHTAVEIQEAKGAT